MSRKPSKPAIPTLNDRAAGLLLHLTSLAGAYGTGDLGHPALGLVNWLKKAGFRWWQMLPITPASPENSPYESISAFAGWHALISLEALVDDGLLTREELAAAEQLPTHAASFTQAQQLRYDLLQTAFQRFEKDECYAAFLDRESAWLGDWCLHEAIRTTQHGKPWHQWPEPLRLRRPKAIDEARVELAQPIAFHAFVQFTFERQWHRLRQAAHDAGIGLIGDVPIFVGMDAADVWAHRELFDLEPDGSPKAISGVPPDMFSDTGQVWDHPLYRWAEHEHTNYAWWAQRMRRTLNQFDAVRIDHFLGFCRNWAIPAKTRDARDGKYRPGPGSAFFASLVEQLGPMPVIAEDLGVVTDEARALRDAMKFPGMSVTQFGFDEPDAEHAPHNHPRHAVAYTGTHDNDTLHGYYQTTSAKTQQRILAYTGGTPDNVAHDLTRITLASPATTAIIPPQDLLNLDTSHRMNVPGKKRGNWTWRLDQNLLTPELAHKLHTLNEATGRLPKPKPAKK
ncbi:4-alpha-glucanotransferase [Mucisphaera sp.]|uniref:4-alpha-glucanotransferase n=1 Tax=Mucisphaera sp. TaxID=2913024 RepID=UPI003D0DB184